MFTLWWEIFSSLLATLLTAAGIWGLKILAPFIKDKLANRQLADVTHWVGIAVEAAEMLFQNGKRGPEKLQYVKEFLIHAGFDMDEAKMRALIERAVFRLGGTDW